MLTPFPGTVDFERWEKKQNGSAVTVDGILITRYWLIPPQSRPKMFMPHPFMSSEEIRERTQDIWNRFYSLPSIWKRSQCATSLRSRLAFMFISKLYRQMYAKTGISSDSARKHRANVFARWLAKPCLHLFRAKPMPHLQVPQVHTPTQSHFTCCKSSGFQEDMPAPVSIEDYA